MKTKGEKGYCPHCDCEEGQKLLRRQHEGDLHKDVGVTTKQYTDINVFFVLAYAFSVGLIGALIFALISSLTD